jgi:hypothetical protein
MKVDGNYLHVILIRMMMMMMMMMAAMPPRLPVRPPQLC